MSRFSAIVCDHCDTRDIVDLPPNHDIQQVSIFMNVDGKLIPFADKELCGNCRKNLHDEIIRCITQIPRAA